MMQSRALISHDENWFASFCSQFDVGACRTSIAASHDLETEQVLWTDGACSNNQDFRFRRAGSGIFYGDACVQELGGPAAMSCADQSESRAFCCDACLSA